MRALCSQLTSVVAWDSEGNSSMHWQRVPNLIPLIALTVLVVSLETTQAQVTVTQIIDATGDGMGNTLNNAKALCVH